MSVDVANIGKAYCKVVLYNKLPNLIINQDALRKSYFLSLAMQTDDKVYELPHLGIQKISMENSGEPSAGGIMPAICYEPVDNFINSVTTTTDYNIQWEQQDPNLSYLFPALVKEKDSTFIAPKQLWTNHQMSVSVLKYNAEDFERSPLKLSSLVTGVANPAQSQAQAQTATNAPTTTVPVAPVEPETIQSFSYIYQMESGTSPFWSAKTRPFKPVAAGFWVSIFPATAYHPDSTGGKKSTAWIGIEFNHDGTGTANGGRVNNSPYFLMISNKGETFIRYYYDNKIRDVPVNMPHLSEAFQNGTEIRVGFFTIASRICIYTDQNRYDTVFLDRVVGLNGKTESQKYNQYVFGTNSVSIFGYGCSALINVCPMTFVKKSWIILDNMDGEDDYTGYITPEETGGGVTKGTWADGSLICWNIGKLQHSENNYKPMYSAQYGYYAEVREIASTAILPSGAAYGNAGPINRCNVSGATGNGVPEDCGTPPGPGISGIPATYSGLTVNNGQFNCYPQWGKIWIVRSNPVQGVYKKKFWYVFFETEDIQARYNTGVTVTHQRIGYPILYNVFSRKLADTSKSSGSDIEAFGYRNVSEDVMQVDISQELDTPDKFSTINQTATITLYDPDGSYAQYLTRARGVKIWMKWGKDGEPADYGAPLFGGVAFGEKYSMKPGIDTITITCQDYWTILDRVMIKNSPFYDGFEAVSVIKDLAERIGIFVTDDVEHANVGFYYLGSGFSFDQPMHRYQSNDSLKDCLIKSVQMFPYYLWFGLSKDPTQVPDFSDLTLHVGIIPADFDWGQTGAGWDNTVYEYYYRRFSQIPAARYYKIILNEVTMTSTLSTSIYNSFKIIGVDRQTNAPIIKTDSNVASITNPNSVGYLGFVSEKEHNQPAIDTNTISVFLNRFKKIFSAPGYQTTIQTIGHKPKFRCGQFIKILETPANDREKFRATSIKHQYDAEKNSWYTSIGAYQIRQVSWAAPTSSSSSSAAP